MGKLYEDIATGIIYIEDNKVSFSKKRRNDNFTATYQKNFSVPKTATSIGIKNIILPKI